MLLLSWIVRVCQEALGLDARLVAYIRQCGNCLWFWLHASACTGTRASGNYVINFSWVLSRSSASHGQEVSRCVPFGQDSLLT